MDEFEETPSIVKFLLVPRRRQRVAGAVTLLVKGAEKEEADGAAGIIGQRQEIRARPQVSQLRIFRVQSRGSRLHADRLRTLGDLELGVNLAVC